MAESIETTRLMLIAALCAALALLLAAGVLRAVRRRRLVRASALGVGTGGLVVIAALLGGIVLNLHTYRRFTLEQDVAQLAFTSLAPQLYEVRVRLADGSSRRVELAGDEWQLDARVLKWSGFATVLGFEPVYRLERLSGRYRSTEQELTAPRTVESFATDRGLDLWASARISNGWIPWVDAVYGSAAYLPMRDGALYRVTISHSGLLARPVNDVAIKAVANWD